MQKNRALDLAHGDWVLSLDADEWLSPGLWSEIRATVTGTMDYDAYRIPRLSSFCGKFCGTPGGGPTASCGCFGAAVRFSDDLVHEKLIVQGSVGTLSQLMLHESFASLEEVLDKINRYSSAGAQMMVAEGRAGSLTSAVAHGAWTFMRTYFFKAGFMDGREGFMLSVSNAEGVYYRYLKAWLLGKR